MKRILLCAVLLVLSTISWGAEYRVSLGVDCDTASAAGVCFVPTPLTIAAGDYVTFYIYGDAGDLGEPHNVAADDGSFRCAKGCDGQGGSGDPANYTTQWKFTRQFTVPGIVAYHDQVSGARGEIYVQPAPIGPGITGAWYDPDQSGQGLLIEVLPNNLFYATWLTYNPAGTQQVWITGIGTYSGNFAYIGDAEMPTGGRWIPNFDPAQVTDNHWGTLSFQFGDCNHGAVKFYAADGYGTGSMNLTRLTQPAGLTCP